MENYKKIKIIACGAFGKVYDVKHVISGDIFVMKEIKVDCDKKLIERELSISGLLQHPNIVKCYKTQVTDENAFIVMEKCNTSLRREILRNAKPNYMSEKALLNMMC